MPIVRKSGPSIKNLKVAIEGLNGKEGRVGWFESAKYEDGTQVAYVAAIQEYGYAPKKIPPRPFMRATIVKQRKAWAELARQGCKAVIEGRWSIGNVMESIGLKAAGDIAKTITQITSPALKPATIKSRMRKRADKKTVGSLTKPLIDTGHMLATLTNDVVNK